MGIFDKKSSSTTTNLTETTNTDNRMVAGEGAGTVNASGASTVYQTVTAADPDIVKAALDTVADSNKLQGNALDAALSTSASMFDTATKQIAGAYSKAQNDSRGSIEQKTIVVIVIALAAVFGVFAWKGAK